jgi:uncharacterized protein with ATP-grasp and redox domains
MAREIHELVRAVGHIEDPFAAIKAESNRVCRQCVPFLAETVQQSPDRLATATKLSIAGNLLDFGAYRAASLFRRDIVRIAREVLGAPLTGSSLAEFRDVLHDAGAILYIADNAGECFFDAFLLNIIGLSRVTYAVRGGPVLNDATVADARSAGIHTMCRVMDTGDQAPGVLLDRCSREFQDAFSESDLIIAKGQGNYESLSGLNGSTMVFLTKVKCEVLARDIGHPVGSNVIEIQRAP